MNTAEGKRCKQCKRVLPASAFYPIRGSGWRVTKCDGCAQANMRLYAIGVERDPDKVRRRAVED